MTRAGRGPLVGVLLLAGLSACGGGGTDTAARPRGRGGPIPVVTMPVTASELVYAVEGTGALEAYQVVTATARVEGMLESVTFDEGDAVDSTKDLAVVDGARYQLEVVEAEAGVAQATAAVGRALAGVEGSRANVERTDAQETSARNDLAESEAFLQRRVELQATSPGAVSQEEISTARALVERRRSAVAGSVAAKEQAQSALREAEAAQTEATSAEGVAKARLALAEKRKSDAVVRSPLCGVVRRRHVTKGQYVRPGDPVAEIVDCSRPRIRFRVTEAESVHVTRGLTARFTAPALPGKTFTAELIHVDEVASPATRMVECLAEVKDPDPALKPGFFIVASVETRKARAISVPEDALLPSENGWVAFVVQDGKARRRTLTLGLRTSDGPVEVLEGLSEGDVLVVNGANVLDEGLAVAPTPAPSQAPAPVPGKDS